MQSIIKINGFNDGYGVSSDGRVFTFKQGRNREVKQHEHKGYKRVFLFNENKRKSFFVHRLVALHFIPNPENKEQINHKDGNKLNNRVENLEWCTKAENQKHSREVLGNTNRGVRNGNHGYQKSKFYPSEELRSKLIELGVPRNKHDIVSLGEMLPDIIHNVMRENYTLTCQKVGLWEIGYVKVNGVMLNQEVIEDRTEADARAKMLIWLIENEFLEIKS